MGCASSAALPFLKNRGGKGGSESSPRMNGNPPYELKMVNNKLKENGIGNVKDVNEAYVSEKMKEVVDTTAVQGVIGGIVQAKNEIVDQVKGIGDAVTEAVDGVEEKIDSAFEKLTNAAEGPKSELTSLAGEESPAEMKAEDIDELLSSLPTEEEVKGTGEEATETSGAETGPGAGD